MDTIGTIADIVGDALADRTLVNLYFPQLMEKFFDLEDDDMRLFPILECLTSVVAASGLESQPFAHKLYFRCLRIIGNTMAANAAADAKVKSLTDIPRQQNHSSLRIALFCTSKIHKSIAPPIPGRPIISSHPTLIYHAPVYLDIEQRVTTDPPTRIGFNSLSR